jgi:anaerobic ribonucleoside-triphosphate reductase activating protein
MLDQLDVLVDGLFVEELKDISLRFRGSSNQRLIDMKKSREAGELQFLPDRKR